MANKKAEYLNWKGFTLIEIVVTVAIIGIITALSLIVTNTVLEKSRDTQRLEDIKQIQAALKLYYYDEHQYPDNLIFNDALVGSTSSTTYMNIVPSNPKPWNDGNCLNKDYIYSSINNGKDYAIYYCLGNKSGEITPGCYTITSKTQSATNCFYPTDVADLEAWFDAGADITYDQAGNISVWADMSGNNNNGTNVNGYPQYISSATTINNNPLVRIDGGAYFFFPMRTANEYTFISVLSPGTTQDGWETFLGSNHGDGKGVRWSLGIGNNGEGSGWGGVDGTIQMGAANYISANQFKIITYTKNLIGWKIYSGLDLQKEIADTSAPSYSDKKNWAIGSEPGYAMVGDIAEVIIYRRVITETERQKISEYLSAKYGIGI